MSIGPCVLFVSMALVLHVNRHEELHSYITCKHNEVHRARPSIADGIRKVISRQTGRLHKHWVRQSSQRVKYTMQYSLNPSV